MEFFGGMNWTSRLFPSRRTQPSIEVSRMEAYLQTIHKVLVWDDPKLSLVALGVLHILLWLVVQLELKFYGAIFIIIMILLLCDLYCERNNVKMERNSSSDAMRQVTSLIKTLIVYLRSLREENPSAFCFAMSAVCFGLLVIARSLSGFSLAYLMLLVIFAGPVLISRIPPEYLSNFREVVETIRTSEGVLAESELLPYITNKDFNEHDPDLDSLLTDKTADSVTNSLISGITSMPSYLDAEGGSLDGLDEEDDVEFALRSNKASGVVFTPGECSSDSDGDHKSMNFESSHFNRDSSSEEENGFAKGLQFSEVSRDLNDSSRLQGSGLASKDVSTTGGILENLTTLGSNLISNVLKTTVTSQNVAPKRNDSDSDFEMIDSEDLA